MKRFAIATLVVSFATLAHADAPKKPAEPEKPAETAKQPPPDEIADVESLEANLESNEPRKGFTFAIAAGGGIRLAGGVANGPVLSLRLGHVATRKTVITFELIRTDAYHKQATMDPTVSDLNNGLFVGAQRYVKPIAWVRAAGGLAVLVKNADKDGTGGEDPVAGVGGLIGGGIDIARWGYFVIGFEVVGMASVSKDGLKAQGGLSLGFSYY